MLPTIRSLSASVVYSKLKAGITALPSLKTLFVLLVCFGVMACKSLTTAQQSISRHSIIDSLSSLAAFTLSINDTLYTPAIRPLPEIQSPCCSDSGQIIVRHTTVRGQSSSSQVRASVSIDTTTTASVTYPSSYVAPAMPRVFIVAAIILAFLSACLFILSLRLIFHEDKQNYHSLHGDA